MSTMQQETPSSSHHPPVTTVNQIKPAPSPQLHQGVKKQTKKNKLKWAKNHVDLSASNCSVETVRPFTPCRCALGHCYTSLYIFCCFWCNTPCSCGSTVPAVAGVDGTICCSQTTLSSAALDQLFVFEWPPPPSSFSKEGLHPCLLSTKLSTTPIPTSVWRMFSTPLCWGCFSLFCSFDFHYVYVLLHSK